MNHRELITTRDRCEHLIERTLRSVSTIRLQSIDCICDNADTSADLMQALLTDLAHARDSQQRLLGLLVEVRDDLSARIATHANAARAAA